MADRTIEILTPAARVDLLTLDEAKLLLGIPASDTSGDAQLQLLISVNSATIARLCNRVFAREEVLEIWREFRAGSPMPPTGSPYYSGPYLPPAWNDNHRIFLSHWPVEAADIESVEAPAGSGTFLDPSEYEIEELSGKLSIYTAIPWSEPVAVTYWGGYLLPDDAPLPLKQAVTLLNVQGKLLSSLGQIAGIRQLSHKEKRVSFHDPMRVIEAAMGGAGSATQNAVMNLLNHYIRIEA
jgi:hypothetical protein